MGSTTSAGPTRARLWPTVTTTEIGPRAIEIAPAFSSTEMVAARLRTYGSSGAEIVPATMAGGSDEGMRLPSITTDTGGGPITGTCACGA